MKNKIALEAAETLTLADLLNDVLANCQVFYMDVRRSSLEHRGDKFLELYANLGRYVLTSW